MRPKFLKITRITISLIFFLLLAFSFVDFSGLMPVGVLSALTYLQVTPSMLKFIDLFNLASAGFIFVLIVTALFGRVYCSTVCPLGVLQDIISFISRKRGKKKKIFKYSKPQPWVRYSILALTFIALIIIGPLLFSLLDPFSNFGKLFSDIVRPIYIMINNGLANLVAKAGYYFLFPVDFKGFNWLVLIYPVIFTALVVFLSYTKGRLHCNLICPIGSLLGLVSKVSLYKIKINKDVCTRCGKCSTSCKAECIDIKEKEVDFSRCVGCFNCIKACPESGIDYCLSKKKVEVTNPTEDTSRRKFIAQALGITGFAVLVKYSEGYAQTTITPGKFNKIKIVKKYMVSPPGSISLEHFNMTCSACHLCVSVCPTHVLQPSIFEYGIGGFMQPRMDFNASFCNFECVKCTEVCPNGAIMPLTKEGKITTQPGFVDFIKENCIVFLDEKSCGACSEHCPTKAVDMVIYKGNLTIPQINTKICVGCGACEYACPAKPNKAIFVDGNPIHKLADKPKSEKIEEKKQEDFPF